MILRNLNKAISIILQEFDLPASLQGTTPLVPGTVFGFVTYPLPDVVSNNFTTLFSVSYGLEDVGHLEIIGISVALNLEYNGNGSVRWQISGDGGISWFDIGQIDFNVAGFTPDALAGSGLWISTIQPGNNKLQFRFQALANAGVVSTILYDVNEVFLTYRKTVLF